MEMLMSVWAKKKNWVNTSIKSAGSSFAVLLDNNYLYTPKKSMVLLPTLKLAQAVADEWSAQKGVIEPQTMPITRLSNSAIDKVYKNFDSILSEILCFGDTDLVCYRAESPEDLVSLQETLWDPILLWAKEKLDVDLKTTKGIIYQPQEPAHKQKLLQELKSFDYFSLTGFYELVTISGSLLIALAVFRDYLSPEDGLNRSFLDEDWQKKQWGQDEESTKNKAYKLDEFQTAFKFLKLLK